MLKLRRVNRQSKFSESSYKLGKLLLFVVTKITLKCFLGVCSSLIFTISDTFTEVGDNFNLNNYFDMKRVLILR